MKNMLTLIAICLLSSACAMNDRELDTTIDYDLEDYETWVMDRHLEKTGISKGGFCDGKGVFRYFESKNYYMVTCKDGSNYTLRKK